MEQHDILMSYLRVTQHMSQQFRAHFGRLNLTFPQALVLNVLGEGDQRSMLEKKISAAGLEEDFILLGAVSNPFPYYAQADLYIHATRFEGKSIAIQEAQTLGCAVIASDCNGNREQIADGVDGILCELTPRAVADSAAMLLRDEEKRKRLGQAASEKKTAQKEELEKLLRFL